MAGDRVGQFVGVDADRFAIGSSTSCEISLPEYRAAGLPRRIAKVRREADGWVVRPASGASMYINADPIDSKAALRSGDIVRLSPSGPELQFLVQHQNQRSLDDIALEHAPQHAGPQAATSPARGQREPPSAAAPSSLFSSALSKPVLRRWRPLLVAAALTLAAVIGLAAASPSDQTGPTPPPADPAAAE